MSQEEEPSVLYHRFTTFNSTRVNKLPVPKPGWKVIFIDLLPGVCIDKLLPLHEEDEIITGLEYYVLTEDNLVTDISYIRVDLYGWLRWQDSVLFGKKWVKYEGRKQDTSEKLIPKLNWCVHRQDRWWFKSWVYIKTQKNTKKFI